MRHDGAGTLEWQPGGDNVLMWTRRKVPEPVQASLNALVSPGRTSVMPERSSIHPRFDRLSGREIPRLCLSDPVQLFVYVRHMGDILPQTSDVGATSR
jgi:hypothetical protein